MSKTIVRSDTLISNDTVYIMKDYSQKSLIELTESANDLFYQFFNIYTLLVGIVLIVLGVLFPIGMRWWNNKKNNEEVDKLKKQVEEFKESFNIIKNENEALENKLNDKITESENKNNENTDTINSKLKDLDIKIDKKLEVSNNELNDFKLQYEHEIVAVIANIYLVSYNLFKSTDKIGGAYQNLLMAIKSYITINNYFLVIESMIELAKFIDNIESIEVSKLSKEQIKEINDSNNIVNFIKDKLLNLKSSDNRGELIRILHKILKFQEKFKD